jgi:beta-galactosidase
MNVSRIAEFAWSTMEPTESHYELDWLDRAITLLADNGMAVVLGTPTAAPPAWLTHHHPDTVAIDQNGRPAQHGNRCHYNPNSPTYHKYVRRIVEQMAKRFGRDPRVIGWQIDNEYNRVDYSDLSRRQFQQYLKEHYGSLAALNKHWSTAYWSQTYTDWNEIPLPIGPHNPGLMLAHRHFVTRVWRDFQRLQIESLRMYIQPEQFITHNFMGWFDGFDHYDLAEDLDLASWDWYVPTGHHDYTRTGAVHDLTRGLKRKNFWLMETQPGNVNWSDLNTTLDKGESRCMAWHVIGHGADAILYWQWRSALGGQEQLHGSVVGVDGNPRPIYDEIRQLGHDMATAGTLLADTQINNQAAFLHSYDSRWALTAQRHTKDFDPVSLLQHYYAPFAEQNVGVDIISAEASLEGYRLVVAPALVIVSDKTAENLVEFVKGGGTLVLTVRCGQKDIHSALFPTLPPGPLREIAGVESAEVYALQDPIPVSSEGGLGSGEGGIWAEMLRLLDDSTKMVARFGKSNGWLDGQCAIAEHAAGDKGGRVITVAAILDDAFQRRVTSWIIETSDVAPTVSSAPVGIEVARRVREDGSAVYIVVNHGKEEAALPLEGSGLGATVTDVLTREGFTGSLPLGPYGVRVIGPLTP